MTPFPRIAARANNSRFTTCSLKTIKAITWLMYRSRTLSRIIQASPWITLIFLTFLARLKTGPIRCTFS